MNARQSGAALLMALTTVALVSTLASAVVWQQWRGWQIERSERHANQLRWLLLGGMDWARLMLRIDAMSNTTDHLGEPWAVPLQEARLSTFLSSQAAQETQDLGDLALDAFLSGRIVDAQGLLNARNLVQSNANGPAVSEPDVRMWQRLFELTGLDPERVRPFAQQWVQQQSSLAKRPDMAVVSQPLQWTALGLSAAEIARLVSYVVALPTRTPLNLNTAPPVVLRAVLETQADASTAQALLQWRDNAPLSQLNEVRQRWPVLAPAVDAQRLSVQSQYFVIQGRVRVDQVSQRVDMGVKREGINVTTLWWHPVPSLEAGL